MFCGVIRKSPFRKDENMAVIIFVRQHDRILDFLKLILLAIFKRIGENFDKHCLFSVPVDSVKSIAEIIFLDDFRRINYLRRNAEICP